MAREEGGDALIAVAEGGERPPFAGKDLGEGRLRAELNHENALALRKLFPFTAPSRALREERSFGLGDRLGIAGPGHIRLFENYDAAPVLAQQSIRELNLTGRTYEEVLDAASFAVFREGFTRGWGADGDHLKSARDVEYALSLGFTMITLDCSEHIKDGVTEAGAPPLAARYREKYLGKVFDIGEGERLSFSEGALARASAVYGAAVDFAADIYRRFLAGGRYGADLEISIDETSTPTSPLDHYFAARELRDAGVEFASLAPRFCGEFQKGIDYIGDLAQFEREIRVHGIIARHLGYKLSIHSGSDKFSVFPAIGRECRGVFHIKTAGTNWLLAMETAARRDPALYREVHRFALSAFDEARAYYHVTTDLSRIPPVEGLSDGELPALFSNNDARQLIHITYGLILTKKEGGRFLFRDRLYQLWRDAEDAYAEALGRHIGRHLDLLGVGKIEN
jgi:hypothetical protein